jgi:Domain of unknown function (DUF4062)
MDEQPKAKRRRLTRSSKLLIQASPSVPPPPDPKKVFVSSTQKDLDAYRNAAAEAITRIDWHPVRPSEHGTVHAGPMLKRCTEEIGRCDLFVLIVGYRYGWVPRTQDGGNGEQSITLMEYECWKLREQLCGQWPAIVLMASNDDRFLSDNETDELRARQVLFRTSVRRETTVHPFRYLSPADPGHEEAVREFAMTLRDQLVQAKDRMAEQTRVQALRAQAEAQKHVKAMQQHLEHVQQQLVAAQAELTRMREHQPGNALALLTVGGLIGAGLTNR